MSGDGNGGGFARHDHDTAVRALTLAIGRMVERRGFPAEAAAEAAFKAAWLLLVGRLGCAPHEAEELGRRMFAALSEGWRAELGEAGSAAGSAPGGELDGDLDAAGRDLGDDLDAAGRDLGDDLDAAGGGGRRVLN